jgi:hypothetical protein
VVSEGSALRGSEASTGRDGARLFRLGVEEEDGVRCMAGEVGGSGRGAARLRDARSTVSRNSIAASCC